MKRDDSHPASANPPTHWMKDMNFGLIVIGSELMTGKRKDGHFEFVIRTLAERGLDLSWCQYLGDEPDRLIRTLRHHLHSGDAIFSFGGIGATPDDRTRACAAAAAGVALVPHPDAVAIMQEQFGAAAYPRRIRMAQLPAGCKLIPNPVNRIAGFSIGHLHFVPGFPHMGQPMVEWVLDEHYAHLHRSEAPVEVLYHLPGTNEGELMDLMETLVERFPEVQLSCLPHAEGAYRETELGLRGIGAAVEEADDWLRRELDEARLTWEANPRSDSV